ncbi:hypothetical protein [Hymenobacter coccineus]|uniref:Uncharacterized protein n=1 Tax=Hymenobacter coccineus TaxID=1908235 RepID=A0A1G1THA1_9BACT|nr:hypothetical protein [Hymenobacter coccineus]OGX90256.1 hypothetical protein BEN49_23385 [Hymenobacter coccineus]
MVNGDELLLAEQLRPGMALRLQKIITQHLRHDPPRDGDSSLNMEQWDADQLVSLPDGLGLTYTGLLSTYGDDELPSLGVVTVNVPWRDLIPLLRPDSPVARMLRQRGLWPGVGPKRQ